MKTGAIIKSNEIITVSDSWGKQKKEYYGNLKLKVH